MVITRNKKGFLLAEETLKIILAVIAIVFLAYLLFSLYNSGKTSKDMELAKDSLSTLEKGLNANSSEIMIYNPSNWYITSWSNTLPNSCSNIGWKSCICICDGDTESKCDASGSCFENTRGFKFSSIKISNPPVTLNVNYELKTISKN